MDKFNSQYATRKLREESVTSSGPGSSNMAAGDGEQYTTRTKKNETIKKVGDKYAVYPEKGGKRLGTHDSKAKAQKQLAAIEISKAKNESKDVEPKLAAGEAENYVKDHWGWKEAPSVPNRPSKGGFQYKKIFENMTMSDVELDYPEFTPMIKYVFDYLGIDPSQIEVADYTVDDMRVIASLPEEKEIFIDVLSGYEDPNAPKNLNVSISTPTRSAQYNLTYKPGSLNESYSRFKKETKTRTNEQQLHTAMRLAEKKIREANRILEYTSQLRGELNETRMNKNTQKLMERITRGIAEAYSKMKKIK